MFRRIEDFQNSWKYETESTLKVMRACTDASLSQAVTPAGRTLGRLAWHITVTLPEMMGHAGLPVSGPAQDAPIPTLAEIVSAYEQSAAAVAAGVAAQWNDGMMEEQIPMYGQQWRRGDVLSALIAHQTHHRGQMTVLMRQAGLTVPGVYGPAAEEWAQMGMPAMP